MLPLYEDEQMDLDVIEGVDEDGNKVLLQVMDYFFYNGEEYVILADAEDEEGQVCSIEDGSCEHNHEDEEIDLYIMKVISTTGDDGEEMEEFVPVEDDLMDTLIEVVQTNFLNDDELEDE